MTDEQLTTAARFRLYVQGVTPIEIIRRDDDPVGDELAKLRVMGLMQTAALVEQATGYRRSARAIPDGCQFDPGFGEAIRIASYGANILGLTGDEVLGFVERHARGDHGLWKDTTAVMAANAAAIRDGAGVVRSRYAAYRPHLDRPSHETGRAVEPRRRNLNEWVEVLTLLQPGSPPETIVTTSVDASFSG